MESGNLLDNLPAELPTEFFEVLAEGEGKLKIERIVSRQHVSPPDYWYDQTSTEWVLIIQGAAVLRFENQPQPSVLKVGDWIKIPAHSRHQVVQTSEQVDTVWLAIHWE